MREEDIAAEMVSAHQMLERGRLELQRQLDLYRIIGRDQRREDRRKADQQQQDGAHGGGPVARKLPCRQDERSAELEGEGLRRLGYDQYRMRGSIRE